MRYPYSQIDRSNLGWFEKDASKATLISLEITDGQLRGVGKLKLRFRYPITAISGKNGTGKTTLLACAACAFHNDPSGFKTLSRRVPYYTFSDFFIQSSEEEPIAFVYIKYEILYDGWRATEEFPEGVGLGQQWRWKAFGRWNNYASRVERNVVFCGIERVVPHSEKSVSKSYRKAFQRGKAGGYEADVAETVGRILGRPYEEFYYTQHSKYRLPLVRTKDRRYSGFNMGAGESTLFEVFSIINGCTGSLLLVIDEIELGLHEEAQLRFIAELKSICAKRHIQVICTTHSPRILSALPPEGRLHVERTATELRVIPGISPEYASGLLSGVKQAEMDVLCEDEFARDVLALALPNDLRSRVNIIPIGSAVAVMRQMSARLREKPDPSVCAILDGDQSGRRTPLAKEFTSAFEDSNKRPDAEDWVSSRLTFLPGKTSPEKWVLSCVSADVSANLSEDLGATKESIRSYVEEAAAARQHTGFHLLSQRLNLPPSTLKPRLIRTALRRNKDEVIRLTAFLEGLLSQ